MQHYALVFVIFVCLWGIASPRLRTGIFATVGLMLTISGCLAALDGMSNLERAFNLRTYGLVAIGWGLVWRFIVRPWWLRAAVHWRPVAGAAHFWGIIDRRIERRSAQRHKT